MHAPLPYLVETPDAMAGVDTPDALAHALVAILGGRRGRPSCETSAAGLTSLGTAALAAPWRHGCAHAAGLQEDLDRIKGVLDELARKAARLWWRWCTGSVGLGSVDIDPGSEGAARIFSLLLI